MFVSDADATITTQRRTPEGLLIATARLQREGPYEYDAAELGVGEKGTRVTVNRTRESLLHPETAQSLTTSPVTGAHPRGGEDVRSRTIHPDNYRDHSAGWIVGTPRMGDDGYMYGEIVVADRDAIGRIEAGDRELSVGYDIQVRPAPPGSGTQYESVGPIRANHVALVNRGTGRAGPGARVLDQKGGFVMDAATVQTLQAMIDAGVTKAVSGLNGTGQNVPGLADALKTALAPMAKQMEDLQAEQAKQSKAQQDEADKKEREEAANKLAATVQAVERTRFAVVQDAMPFFPPEQRATLLSSQMDTKQILVAALKDRLPGAENYSEDFLRGTLATLAQQQAAGPGTPGFNQFRPAGFYVQDQNPNPGAPGYGGVPVQTTPAQLVPANPANPGGTLIDTRPPNQYTQADVEAARNAMIHGVETGTRVPQVVSRV